MKRNIIIFWDSIIQWVYWEKWYSWADLLKSKNHTDIKSWWLVFNMWITWDTIEWLLNRFDNEVKYRQSDIIIFAIWINDSLIFENNNRLIPFYTSKQFEINIDLLIKKAEKLKSKIYFVWLTKVDERFTAPFPNRQFKPHYKNDRIKKFDAIIKQYCIKNNINYIYMFDLLDSKGLSDWLHPNQIWHNKMYDKIVKNLK